ncbi:MnuA family membrane nuclease [Metamycoplasma neophronis]|uniref:Uncharacterized protein n=1 Tax=Metamycoplasma neophronis TaxID=872983 RepID=A0ABY2YZ72_9BACT|nr:hypothetical protein [Metamycoplasma neophronis]TPR53206.1 hypothetical protein FJR74_02965 [Metamycoplasma neophronis]
MNKNKKMLFMLVPTVTFLAPLLFSSSCEAKYSDNNENINKQELINLEANIKNGIGLIDDDISLKNLVSKLQDQKDNIKSWYYRKNKQNKLKNKDKNWEAIFGILQMQQPNFDYSNLNINGTLFDSYDLTKILNAILPMILINKPTLNDDYVSTKMKRYFKNMRKINFNNLINLAINKRELIFYLINKIKDNTEDKKILQHVITLEQYLTNINNDEIQIKDLNINKKRFIRALLNSAKYLKEVNAEEKENINKNLDNAENNNYNETSTNDNTNAEVNNDEINASDSSSDLPSASNNDNEKESQENHGVDNKASNNQANQGASSSDAKNQNKANNNQDDLPNSNEDINYPKPPIEFFNNPFASKLFHKPSKHFRIGHWNILNYGKASLDPEGLKVNNIAKAILATQADIMGLTEVNYNHLDKVSYIVNLLNKWTNSNEFQYLGQKDIFSEKYPSQKENIAIIYRKSIATPILFDNGKIGASFTKKINRNDGKTEYVRPPYGTMFKIKGYEKPLITIFGHLDSPGAKQESGEKKITLYNNIKIQGSQGNQEVAEMMALPNVFEYFLSLAKDKDAAIMFGGDTNIKKENQFLLQELENKYNLTNYYYDYHEKYLTSLGRNNNYSQSYDKILFKENADFNFISANEKANMPEFKKVPYRLDTINAFNNKIWDRKESINLNNQDATWAYDNKTSDFQLALKISDHTPVFIDFINK